MTTATLRVMTEEELRDALSGLHAYDTGCVQSGIHDEKLRERVIQHLEELAKASENDWRLTMSRIVRELYLTDEALEQQYGIEDVADFIRWLDDRMGISL